MAPSGEKKNDVWTRRSSSRGRRKGRRGRLQEAPATAASSGRPEHQAHGTREAVQAKRQPRLPIETRVAAGEVVAVVTLRTYMNNNTSIQNVAGEYANNHTQHDRPASKTDRQADRHRKTDRQTDPQKDRQPARTEQRCGKWHSKAHELGGLGCCLR
jgi:hypothetical protein